MGICSMGRGVANMGRMGLRVAGSLGWECSRHGQDGMAYGSHGKDRMACGSHRQGGVTCGRHGKGADRPE